MPNLRKPTYSSQIGAFMETPENAATIKAWATHANITHGAVMRLVIEIGLNRAGKALAKEYGELPSADYAAALAVEKRRGAERAARGAQAKRDMRSAASAQQPVDASV